MKQDIWLPILLQVNIPTLTLLVLRLKALKCFGMWHLSSECLMEEELRNLSNNSITCMM